MKILSQVAVLACLLLSTGVAHSTESPPFELLKAMSAADFRKTGLDHLTDAQLQALDAWIGSYAQKQASARCTPPASDGTPSVDVSKQAPAPSGTSGETVVARLIGNFTGWANGKRFALDNGQVWEQIDDTLVSHSSLENPKVTITGGLFNARYLSVEGVSDSVVVRLIAP
ncbi:MAG TPA: hypothetical protein VLG68_07160 [Gammaproteobacteria bacterium]|nr:hypothetical protein [Gammaproteobacteria bacterium]